MARRSEPPRDDAACAAAKVTPQKPPPRKPRKRPLDPRRVRARLLTHIERQIDRFDAALEGEPSLGLDSGKVLRDLGGLKNLLDDMMAADRSVREGGAEDAGGRSLSAANLVAMRADIARRYAAFAAAEPDDGLPEAAAAGASAPA